MHAKIISFNAEDICPVAFSAGVAEQEYKCRREQGIVLDRITDYVYLKSNEKSCRCVIPDNQYLHGVKSKEEKGTQRCVMMSDEI